MPARYTLHVALTKPLVTYVAQQVATGHYTNASAMVRAGLQLLIEHDEAESSFAQLSGGKPVPRKSAQDD